MLSTREEKTFCTMTYLETKIIENCLKIDTTHLDDKYLLLRQETQKKIACPGSWYNNNKKTLIWYL